MTELIRRSADGKNLEIFSPSIGTQLVERGRIDEVDHLHVLPRLLGDGTRLHDVADGPCPSCRTWSAMTRMPRPTSDSAPPTRTDP